MSAVWKYDLAITDVQTVSMPRGARVLSVHSQRDVPCLWALVDPLAARVTVRVEIHGTGHEVGDKKGMRFVGTCLTHGESLVWHVWVAE